MKKKKQSNYKCHRRSSKTRENQSLERRESPLAAAFLEAPPGHRGGDYSRNARFLINRSFSNVAERLAATAAGSKECCRSSAPTVRVPPSPAGRFLFARKLSRNTFFGRFPANTFPGHKHTQHMSQARHHVARGLGIISAPWATGSSSSSSRGQQLVRQKYR